MRVTLLPACCRLSPPTGAKLRALRGLAAVAALSALAACTTVAPPAAPATAGTAAPEKAPATARAAPKIPEVDVTPRMIFGLIAAEIGLQRGEGGYAYAEYMRIARDTRDPRLARRATEIALSARAVREALDAATLWHDTAPGDTEAEGTLASLLLASGRFEEARPLLERQLAANPDPLAVLDRMERMLGHAGDPVHALALVEALAARWATDPERGFDAQVVMARAARAAGQPEKAAAHARAALALRPDSESAVLTLAQALPDDEGANGKAGREVAIALLGRWLATHEGADARQAYARLLAAEGHLEESRAQFEKLLAADPGRVDTLYALGLIDLDAERFAAAHAWLAQYLERIARMDRDPEAAWIGLGRAAEGLRHYDEALDWLRKVRSPARNDEAREREAFVLAHLGRLDDALALIEALPAANDEERGRKLLARGQLLREGHRYAESFDLFEAALRTHPDDTGLLYESAMSAERLDRIEVMEARLRRVLALQPEAAHAWNALGFTFADRNIRLDEALSLIGHALALSPDDGYIIDSMGWVQFRMGRLAAARESLQRAYHLKEDPEVAAHLGEVLWALGEHDAARDLLLEARRRDGGSEALNGTIERLRIQP